VRRGAALHAEAVDKETLTTAARELEEDADRVEALVQQIEAEAASQVDL